MERIDLDANASTPCDPEVIAAMVPFLVSANPSSPHQPGQRARHAIELARRQVARLVGTSPEDVIFTSGGTEAASIALAGLARGARSADPARDRVVVSAIEHPAVMETARALESEGFHRVIVNVDKNARLQIDDLEASIGPETAAVAVMVANNETGTVQPVTEVVRAAARHDSPVLADAVQAAGKIPLQTLAPHPTALVISAHKINGPQGAGALVLQRPARWLPSTFGGSQEKRRRPGTENVAAIVGFGRAAELAVQRMEADSRRIGELRDRLEARILKALPTAFVTGRDAARTCNTLSLTLPGIAAETLVIRLDLEGISASTGAACSTGVMRPSPTLVACGLSPEQAHATVRLSLARTVTADQIERVALLIPRLAIELQRAGAVT